MLLRGLRLRRRRLRLDTTQLRLEKGLRRLRGGDGLRGVGDARWALADKSTEGGLRILRHGRGRHFCLKLGVPLACSAFQLPFKVPFLSSNSVVEPEPPTGTPRIAIIGAGAGGSSAAFWIAATKERFGLDVEVDVYEKESYVGGRSTIVYPYNDTTLPPVELGGSIFVKANKNMWRASEEFNLTRRNFDDPNSTMGVWDGSSMLFSVSSFIHLP